MTETYSARLPRSFLISPDSMSKIEKKKKKGEGQSKDFFCHIRINIYY